MHGTWSKRVELILTAVLAACAVVMTTAVLSRRGSSPDARSPSVAVVRDWESFRTGRVVFGAGSPQVQAVVFSDFQCPFCSTLARRLDSLVSKYPQALAVEFRHFPIRALHPWAEAAARASECANSVGAFKTLHDSLFANGSRLYPEMITRLAAQAGVADTSWLQSCVGSPAVTAALRDDSLAAIRLEVAGTPTLLLNHLKIVGAPTVAELDPILATLLQLPKANPSSE